MQQSRFALTHYRDQLCIPSTVWALVALVGLAWTFTSVWLGASASETNFLAGYGNLDPPVLL